MVRRQLVTTMQLRRFECCVKKLFGRENTWQKASDKGLLSSIYKGVLKLNRQQTPRLKNGPRTLRYTSTRKVYRWANKHVKRCCTSYFVREIKIETLHTYWNGQNLEHWQHQMLERTWSNRNFHSFLVGVQNGTATWKTVEWFLRKRHISLAYKPASPGI